MNQIGGDRGVQLMALALDGLAAKQRAIANNIANADTPGYQRQSVPFAEVMQAAMDEGGAGAMALRPPAGGASFGTDASSDPSFKEVLTAGKNDGNKVEIEREMTDLTENQIQYYAVAGALGAKLASLREIITRAT